MKAIVYKSKDYLPILSFLVIEQTSVTKMQKCKKYITIVNPAHMILNPGKSNGALSDRNQSTRSKRKSIVVLVS